MSIVTARSLCDSTVPRVGQGCLVGVIDRLGSQRMESDGKSHLKQVTLHLPSPALRNSAAIETRDAKRKSDTPVSIQLVTQWPLLPHY